ncbi:hypothetical protein PpBr36_00520 [Pyricularia pennisetigena]|uniref:hypothetical protein n=1 Tax=Pyricularia pennisetigena TaxID=1578925 RepID=UPI001150C7C2|nr:hypothetical protein PpBr36_00520 [Pyricularia pennisetigena]TLS29075.1 hypothetical protein PpBr36_00520 [Pyricularia pennisetigena]
MHGESGDIRPHSTGGPNSPSTSENNDWTIVSLGGINIETTNNALTVRRQSTVRVFLPSIFFSCVLNQGGGGIGPGAGSPDSREAVQGFTHRCYTKRKVGEEKKKKKEKVPFFRSFFFRNNNERRRSIDAADRRGVGVTGGNRRTSPPRLRLGNRGAY